MTTIHSTCDSYEAWRFQNDPFSWLCECFRNGKMRQQHMESVLSHLPINANLANAVKSKICELVDEDYVTFYPKVIISYSTGNRKEYDADSAGPGLMIAAAIIAYLFDKGYPCYSDIMTPPGRNWTEYMSRVHQAKVMILVMTIPYFLSVNCLLEAAEANRRGVELIPIRCDEKSRGGFDIARDMFAMWPDEELEKYASLKNNSASLLRELKLKRNEVVSRLTSISSLPAHSTILSEPVATYELVKRVTEVIAHVAVVAIYDFTGNLARGQISFRAGQEIVVTQQSGNGWLFGHISNQQNRRGWFPPSYVVPIRAVPAILRQAQESAFPSGKQDEGGGFDGPIMGGSRMSPPALLADWEQRNGSTSESSQTPPSYNSKAGSSPDEKKIDIRNSGSSVQTAPSTSSSSGSAASLKGVKKAGNALRAATTCIGKMFCMDGNNKSTNLHQMGENDRETCASTNRGSPKRVKVDFKGSVMKRGLKNCSLSPNQKPDTNRTTTTTTHKASKTGPQTRNTASSLEKKAGIMGSAAVLGSALELTRGNVKSAAATGALGVGILTVEGNLRGNRQQKQQRH